MYMEIKYSCSKDFPLCTITALLFIYPDELAMVL
jgi:hypothetical protein